MIHEPLAWLHKVNESGAGIQTSTKISREELLEELILMGLRLKNGLENKILQKIIYKNMREIFDYNKLQTLINQGLIAVEEERIKITDSGRILTNAIITKVVATIKPQ